ncbi:OLC1v1012754C1 [Oldenlandia corymbosa var. corymbosa]|uniref:OLC1v1012754C1 n=1 Tax=Oldenlandia corymbosa var. corymbosa TaxID=529605 RepID=A0AAV1DWX2_OLDCO|nr:OLC1v1012754C1 [Oldenlandia corymbosa var. corymbosa]
MASLTSTPLWNSCTIKRNGSEHEFSCRYPRQYQAIKAMKIEKSLEELYNVKVERKVSKARLAELGVSKWSVWKTGKCQLPWDWHVDQLVYVEEGEVRVVPDGSERYMRFVAGDLIRYPKWFEADLWFNDFYQERYRFLAYGDE